MFPDLKDLMACVNPYSIKPLKEVDQDSGCKDYMKRCDSSKNFIHHISSFGCFTTKNK